MYEYVSRLFTVLSEIPVTRVLVQFSAANVIRVLMLILQYTQQGRGLLIASARTFSFLGNDFPETLPAVKYLVPVEQICYFDTVIRDRPLGARQCLF